MAANEQMNDGEKAGGLRSYQAIRHENAGFSLTFADVCGSKALSDDDFLAQLEACTLPKAQWRHGDHLRLAWCYLGRFGAAEAEERMAGSLRRYSASLGAANKYHETMTRAWLRLITVARSVMPEDSSFEALLLEHQWLLDKQRPKIFYSPERLERGRAVWIEPDLRPLPCGYWCCR